MMNKQTESESTSRVLVGITTYAGSLEQRLILKKILRHLRWRNHMEFDVLVVSDGQLEPEGITPAADHLLCRDGPCGLQQGELDSLRIMARFAADRGYQVLVKLAGDVLMNSDNWLADVVAEMKKHQARILSTHWFHDDSWVVGTKFFVADVDFLNQVLPVSLDGELLENALTQSIAKRHPLEQVAFLINSMTGERHEVSGKLAEWQWEHGHRLHKFHELDAGLPGWKRSFNKYLVYWPIRLYGSMERELGRFKKKRRALPAIR
jgi:hypothetical protein